MKPTRLFYLPNEGTEGDQVGPRKAFRLMHEAGQLADYRAYSYLVEKRRHARQQDALVHLLQAAQAFQPTLIFWQHITNEYPVDDAFLRALKALPSRPTLVWHDPEGYGRWIKPLDDTMRRVIAAADIAVIKGLGYMAREVRKAGARQVMFSPESFDDERFGTPWQPPIERRYDAVMIGNLPCLKRIPWLYLPGGRQRKRTAQAFHQAYGDRFAVFGAGQGWQNETYCKGPIAFNEQESTIRSAWISVNWTQFDEIPMYFSDRLPISLATGVPHITNNQQGLDHVLPPIPGLYRVRSPQEAVDVADYLLSLPREQLIQLGLDGRAFAHRHLNAATVYRDLMTAIGERIG